MTLSNLKTSESILLEDPITDGAIFTKKDFFLDLALTTTNEAIRRLLYVPFDKVQKLAMILRKYPYIKAFILDSEDAIPNFLKDNARENFLREITPINDLRVEQDFMWGCRINKPLLKGLFGELDHGRKDLDAVMPHRPNFLVIPKINNPKELNQIADLCAYYESDRELTKFILIIESLEGAKHVSTLLNNPRVIAAIPGAQDFALDLLEKYYSDAITDVEHISSPFEIAFMFRTYFNALREKIVKISYNLNKIPIAPSSFTSNYETSRNDYIYELLLYGFSARTGIHPEQFPTKEEFEYYMGLPESEQISLNRKKEMYFPELRLKRLQHYLRLAMENKIPGYFTFDKKNPTKTIPNQFGKPVVKMIFLMLCFHLAYLIKHQQGKEAVDLRRLLIEVKQKFGYKHEVDLVP